MARLLAIRGKTSGYISMVQESRKEWNGQFIPGIVLHQATV
jgi:hypothetical protein